MSHVRCSSAIVILIAVAMIMHLAWRDANWIDESAHLGAGCHAWATGSLKLYRVNPPLVRVLAAIPIVVSRFPINADMATASLRLENAEAFVDRRIHRGEWEYGNNLYNNLGDRYPRYVFASRMTLLPFFIGTAILCWIWGTELFGKVAGQFALLGWCALPEALNWAARITPDSATTFAWLLTWYCAWRCLYEPTKFSFFATGLAWGLSLLIKTSSVLLPVLILMGWTFHAYASGRWNVKRFAVDCLRLATILCVGLVVLNVAYGLKEALVPLKKFSFASERLSGVPAGLIGNRFVGHWMGEIPSPLPRSFLEGIDLQKRNFEDQTQSYLWGQIRRGGWWYYYLFAVLIKTPIGFLVLFASVSAWRLCVRPITIDHGEYCLLVPLIMVVVLVSAQTGINKHLRYMLPAYPSLSKTPIPISNILFRLIRQAIQCCYTPSQTRSNCRRQSDT